MSFARFIQNLGQVDRRMRALALIAFVLAACSPLMAPAQDSCVELFQHRSSATTEHSVQHPAPADAADRFEVSEDLQEVIAQTGWKKRTLSDSELISLLETEARKFMKQTGVDYVENSGVFTILPSQKTPLNRAAALAREVYDSDTVFHPKHLVAHRDKGYVSATRTAEGKLAYHLGLGATIFFRVTRFLRNQTILHEFRHLRFILDLKNRVPSPFYGYIEAVSGQIPHPFAWSFGIFETGMTFEELRTFQSNVSVELFKLSTAVKTSQSKERIKQKLETTHHQLKGLYVIASRTRLIAPELEKLLEMRSFQPTFKEIDGIVWGTIPLFSIDKSLLTMSLPLVSALSATDPLNLHFFRQQLTWLHQSADQIATMSEKHLQAIAAIKDANPSADTILSTIKEIRRTLPHLKRGTPRPKLPFAVRARVWIREKRQHSSGS